MALLENTVRIHASPSKVFSVVCDFATAPSRISGIKRVEMLTNGPTRLGTRFRETRIMFGREATETMEVSQFEPGRSYQLSATSCGCAYLASMRVTDAPGGSTDLTMTFDAKPLTFIAKVMSVLMKPLMKSMCKAIKKDLDDVKASIEGSEVGR